MIRSIFCIAFVVVGFSGGATASHFRGGYISWAPTEREGEVKLFFRLAFKNPYFSLPGVSGEQGEDCTADDKNRNPTKVGGKFDYKYTTSENGESVEHSDKLFDNKSPYYTCTNIRDNGDVNDGWSSGYNETVITLPQHDNLVWDVGYDSCCWLRSLLNYESVRYWRLRTTIDLSPREDLGGRPNTSPYLVGLPIKTVVKKCETNISINAIDPDDDRMECRWREWEKEECKNTKNCGNPPPYIFTMQKSKCKILVDAADAEPGLYAVAVQIEDFPASGGRSEPFSKIPYQFLVKIIERDVDCGRVRTFKGEEDCYAVPVARLFTINLYAETTEPSVPIVSIDMITQPGMNISDLINDGDGRYHVQVSWIPSFSQINTVEQICYQAIDEEGITGNEECVKLFVGGRVPKPIPLPSIPSSKESVFVDFDNTFWQLYFTKEVRMREGRNDATVTFLFDDGTIAYAETINEDNFVNSSTEEPYYVSFTTQMFLVANTNYTIRLESGVVVGTAGCHLESAEKQWKFSTRAQGGRLPPTELLIPAVSVECSPTFMVVYIKRESLPNIDPSILSYDDPDCYGSLHNESHIAVSTMYGKCGTQAILNEDETRVSMINNLFITHGDVLTRSETAQIRVNCSIPSKRVAYVEFNTNSSPITMEVEDTGDSDFSLRMFPDASYRNPYSVLDFPVDVPEDARLYFEAKAFRGSYRAPFLDECVATPTSDPTDSVRYTLIRDGCPMDDTMEFHEGPTNHVRFSVVSFSFIGKNFQSPIFVTCEMRDCKPRTGDCDTNCPEPEVNPNRKKRDAPSMEMKAGDEKSDN